MDYEIPIGSGFSITISAERLDGWCAGLRESRNARICAWSSVHIVNAAADNHPGVSWLKKTNSWRAKIYTQGRWRHLGYFKDKGVAIEARKRAEQERASVRS